MIGLVKYPCNMQEKDLVGQGQRNPQREQQEREQELLIRHAEAINASIIPEIPGHVRTTGSRRQYRAEVISGTLHIIEI